MLPEQRGLEVIGNKSKFISEHVFIFVVFGYVANLLVAKETRQKVFFLEIGKVTGAIHPPP